MNTKELIIVFLVLFMIHLSSCASSSSSTPLKIRPFLLDGHELQKKNKDEYNYKHGTTASRSNLDVTVFRGGGSGGRGGGGGGGGRGGRGGGGRRGGDRDGTTLIPLYTAGTHHNNNNHKGSGNSNHMDLKLNLFLIILGSTTTTFAFMFFY